ncbi:NUDIX hydrolase [Chimaeribacter arupi]|uniref:NUDIX hydrolase n=1 Tax=Chimaeribacter arupi TaxID=2060066 RepID=UPI000C7A2DC7|nr:NUDIX hydrolase [Chimaeribacter arupi]MDV5140323.1 NUDIX hydrolase [Chimaeribacter arupi]PLR42326.1 NUDIX hydrolase [Chimaeribacter arupi]PLR44478.1 NUDIX hydrolase [Chimaeribacter arupi]
MKRMMILIAGPVRSGTDGSLAQINENLAKLAQAALAVYQRGHTPVIGEWLALPLAQTAGSTRIGDEISEAFLYPVAHRLIGHCDAILRLPGASAGADKDVRLGQSLGLTLFTRIEEIPQFSEG